MNENRKRILEMLAEGKINAEEAERLIAALERETPAAEAAEGSEPHPKVSPKYLRVMVETEEGARGDGPAKVNVRVPLQLLRAGVKLASIIPPLARVKVNEALHDKGIELDLGQLKPENLEVLVDQLQDLTVDIDDKKGKVRVSCE